MFKLDLLVINFIKSLITDPYTQFITCFAIYIFVLAFSPEAKRKK